MPGDKIHLQGGTNMKAIFATILSLFFSGLGLVFYGKVGWFFVWLFLGIMTGGLTNILAAAHTIAATAER